ncbi:prephenate dehydratase [Lasius niger]|uniref:Prephenate dehydratase n=1 Tax=Lasius niger TaxID=67767 RepID=A0A0J7NPS0_LASNI|nr:prephenate dehydratase [Lasius niger]
MSDAGSGDRDADLSLEEILREEDAVKARIRARMEVATERQRALERLARLRQVEARLRELPDEGTLRKLRSDSQVRSEDFMQLCKQYFVHLQAGRVVTDDYQIKDTEGNPLYSLSTLIWIKNLQPPTRDVRPVVVRYHIKRNLVHRFYGDDSKTLVTIPATEPILSTSRGSDEVVTSTPMAANKPRVVSCVAGTFIDKGVFSRPVALDGDIGTMEEAIPRPESINSFTMEELLGRYFDPPQTTLVDASSDAPSDTSHEKGNPKRGRKKRPRAADDSANQRTKRAKSKALSRYSKSRLAPLEGDMRPEAASALRAATGDGTSLDSGEVRAEKRQQQHGEDQPRVVVDRLDPRSGFRSGIEQSVLTGAVTGVVVLTLRSNTIIDMDS